MVAACTNPHDQLRPSLVAYVPRKNEEAIGYADRRRGRTVNQDAAKQPGWLRVQTKA